MYSIVIYYCLIFSQMEAHLSAVNLSPKAGHFLAKYFIYGTLIKFHCMYLGVQSHTFL